MELPDEYKQAQLGGEHVILRKSKVNEDITQELCLDNCKQAGLNLRIKENINIKL